MAAAAASARGKRQRNRAPAGGAAHAVGNDDDEEKHLNPWDDDLAGFCRSGHRNMNMASRARWVEEIGAAEVVESRGKMWLTTGVDRAGKLYYNVEEIGFLAEIGALILLSDKDETIRIKDIYEKLAGGNYGCTWDTFQAYKHLKSLGYVVGRFGVSWTMKHSGTFDTVAPRMSIVETDQSLNRVDRASSDITKLLKEMLGYIVGRFGVPWTMKHSGTCDTDAPRMSIVETDQNLNRVDRAFSDITKLLKEMLGYIVGRFGVPWSIVETGRSLNRVDRASSDITKLLKKMQIYGISPCFEVYLPNSKFKKSSPGSPSFLLCLLRGKPPSRVELEAVENNFRGIPLKYCHVDNGRVSFLSFDEITLPSLP